MEHDDETGTGWRLELLGGARLDGPGVRLERLERKTAALLAYLALRGATARAPLAELLWPDSKRETGRNNLRQLLRRLREAAGTGLVDTSQDTLRLVPWLTCDAARLVEVFSSGRYAEVARLEGELLHGYAYDDCDELGGWVRGQRDHLRELRLRAGEEEAARLEREGQQRAALEWNLLVLEKEPTRESAWRRSMRLHCLLGDRASALRAYSRCCAVLEHELGMSPMEETQALARDIESGAPALLSERPVRRELPLSVLRPRVLAGRARAWAQLETAWKARIPAFVVGEPGLGKTRLLTEFAATCGRPLLFSSRPGDTTVPFATHARFWRRMLAQRPDVVLPAWVRRELTCILPELEDGSFTSTGEVDKVRLFSAMLELLRLTGESFGSVVADDLQYMDAESFEAVSNMVSAAMDAGMMQRLPHLVAGLRRGEAPQAEALIRRMVEAGLAVRVDLEPLSTPEVAELLGGVDVPEASGLAEPLARFTGGNPLFIIETLKSLIESGELTQGLPRALPPPDRVGAILERRLERLSAGALQLARTLAVARQQFSLELASQVLDSHPLYITRGWEELLAAQLVRDHWFTHDLLYEAVLQHLPAPVGVWLHRRVAEHLSTLKVPAPLLAHHWREAGDAARAALFDERARQEALVVRGS
ncbi:AAA family ATPase [Archangium violaceum]|uniref:BTAD domain-containing putative transcriptional regulator n=1 Tax=Archangium violaceum TaxID=83451 RepID=UPI00194DF1BA|nr:BTAD domain-containing putative transcriptional regulator [Archangium violaceum]QRN97653.1 AAA family ATPase [Archangium violaceum]